MQIKDGWKEITKQDNWKKNSIGLKILFSANVMTYDYYII